MVGRRPAIPWRRINQIERIEPHDWTPVTSTDGVVCQVAQLVPQPRHRNGGDGERRYADDHHPHLTQVMQAPLFKWSAA